MLNSSVGQQAVCKKKTRRGTKSYKSGGVVVFDCLGISKGLQDGVSLQQLLLQLPLVDTRRTAKGNIKHFSICTPLNTTFGFVWIALLSCWVIHCGVLWELNTMIYSFARIVSHNKETISLVHVDMVVCDNLHMMYEHPRRRDNMKCTKHFSQMRKK